MRPKQTALEYVETSLQHGRHLSSFTIDLHGPYHTPSAEFFIDDKLELWVIAYSSPLIHTMISLICSYYPLDFAFVFFFGFCICLLFMMCCACKSSLLCMFLFYFLQEKYDLSQFPSIRNGRLNIQDWNWYRARVQTFLSHNNKKDYWPNDKRRKRGLVCPLNCLWSCDRRDCRILQGWM